MTTSPTQNILVVNVHSTQNAGDAALLWLNLHQLNAAFPEAGFTVLANYPDEVLIDQGITVDVCSSPYALVVKGTKQTAWRQIVKLVLGLAVILVGSLLPAKVLQKRKSGWLSLVRVYRSSDLVAAVSGVQLVSLGKFSWPLILSAMPIILAHIFHLPFYVMPQSIGPLRWKWEKLLVKAIYSPARLVLLRDLKSLQLAKEIGIPEERLRFASDPGFALPASSREQALELLASYGYIPGELTLGLTVISHLTRSFRLSDLNRYYDVLAKGLDRLIRIYNIKVFIFNQVNGPTKAEDDGEAARAVLRLLPEDQKNAVHVDAVLNPMQLKACYSFMDLFIASRLHSGIFSMSSGVPTLFIGYNPKTRGVLEAVGLEKWLVDFTELNEKNFWNLLQNFWEDRQEIAEQTRSIMPECQKYYQLVSQWIAEDYAGQN